MKKQLLGLGLAAIAMVTFTGCESNYDEDFLKERTILPVRVKDESQHRYVDYKRVEMIAEDVEVLKEIKYKQNRFDIIELKIKATYKIPDNKKLCDSSFLYYLVDSLYECQRFHFGDGKILNSDSENYIKETTIKFSLESYEEYLAKK